MPASPNSTDLQVTPGPAASCDPPRGHPRPQKVLATCAGGHYGSGAMPRLALALLALAVTGCFLFPPAGETDSDTDTGDVGNGDLFAAVGDQGTILRSAFGTDWAISTSGVTVALNDVAYGAETYVAVGQAGKILYSPDGIEWSAASSPSSTNRRLVRNTVEVPTESALAITSSVSRRSAASRIWARLTRRTRSCPPRTSSCSDSRSSAVNSTMYRTFTVASRKGLER